jgi:polysaccharide pyruvyl transferase WcaK-like protein
VSYLKENPVRSSVYVQSGSIYSILLVGASTSESVKIVVAHNFKEKYLLKTCFVINNLRDKLVYEDAKDAVSNIQKADLLVSVSSDFVSQYPSKTSIFYVEQQSRNPNRKAIVKIGQKEACGSVMTVADER